MTNFWRRILKGEKGQALPIVLALLVLGGLMIVPSLNIAHTSLNSGKIVKENVNAIYAADAGIELALWSIKHSVSPPAQLPVNMNQMQVAIQTQNMGPYTLAYFTEILNVSASGHYDWLTVGGEIVWDQGAQAYKYTITVTRLPEASGNIKLREVGVKLPIGYTYKVGSAYPFTLNLSRSEPTDTLSESGAHMLSWVFPKPYPELSSGYSTATQKFYITGAGDLTGDYTWVVADRDDVGTVGEVTGTLYIITATATPVGGGEVVAQVRADVLYDAGTGETRIIYWQINPEEAS
ncbi:MAG: hypothetical protein FJ025_03565 [Chloroflexi bacterium]|nr:hypothetical protein [Chloroflexota bacterium]